MKSKLFVVFLVFVLFAPFLLNSGLSVKAQSEQQVTPDVFVGIDVAYENVTEIKSLIDEVSAYTNLFIIGCTGITYNQTLLSEVCQYLYDKNMSFIVYRDYSRRNSTEWFPVWVENAKASWGDNFLGFYYSDEIGGKQLDRQDHMVFVDAVDAHDAATQFIEVINSQLNRFTQSHNSSTDMPLFTSDYALYWFDYKAGYDTLFAEFGWNYSRQLNVALCRGAANVQNKDWGAMITWTYTTPPYIESGKELYQDMVFAYENGAKYIVVFDTNEEYTEGILKEEHLQAMEQFWQYVQENPRNSNAPSERVGFVLPKDYAYGFRGPKDKIWGLWEASAFDLQLSVNVNSLLEQYGDKLDIIYDDNLEQGNNYGYSQLIYWNDTTRFPTYPTPSPSPTTTPSPITTATPIQTPSASPSQTPTPSESTSPTPSPTPQVTVSPEQQSTPIEYGYLIAAGVTLGVVASALVVLRRKLIKN
jgi:hypothetical protein